MLVMMVQIQNIMVLTKIIVKLNILNISIMLFVKTKKLKIYMIALKTNVKN